MLCSCLMYVRLSLGWLKLGLGEILHSLVSCWTVISVTVFVKIVLL